jgi:hypothetical protein
VKQQSAQNQGQNQGNQLQNNDAGLVYTPRDVPLTSIDLGALVQKLLGFVGIEPVSSPAAAETGDPVAIPLPAELLWIDEIVNGHGWEDHGQFDFQSKEEYKRLVLDTVLNATGKHVQHPSKGRTLFWNDKEGFAVWRDKNHPDRGTAYYPKDDRFKKTWGLE